MTEGDVLAMVAKASEFEQIKVRDRHGNSSHASFASSHWRSAKKAIASPQNPENPSRLAQAAKAVSQALNQVINCLPGQRDVDTAIKEIAAASVALTTGQYPPAGDMSFQDVQTSLSVSAAVANSRGTHMQLAQASKKFAGKYNVHSRLMLAGLSKVKGRETDGVRGNDWGF